MITAATESQEPNLCCRSVNETISLLTDSPVKSLNPPTNQSISQSTKISRSLSFVGVFFSFFFLGCLQQQNPHLYKRGCQ